MSGLLVAVTDAQADALAWTLAGGVLTVLGPVIVALVGLAVMGMWR